MDPRASIQYCPVLSAAGVRVHYNRVMRAITIRMMVLLAGFALYSAYAEPTVEVYTGNSARPHRFWTGTAIVGTNQFAHLCCGQDALAHAKRIGAGESSIQPRFWLKAFSSLVGLNPGETLRLQTRVWEIADFAQSELDGKVVPSSTGQDFAVAGCETASSQGLEFKILQPSPALIVGLSWLLSLLHRRGWSLGL